VQHQEEVEMISEMAETNMKSLKRKRPKNAAHELTKEDKNCSSQKITLEPEPCKFCNFYKFEISLNQKF